MGKDELDAAMTSVMGDSRKDTTRWHHGHSRMWDHPYGFLRQILQIIWLKMEDFQPICRMHILFSSLIFFCFLGTPRFDDKTSA